VQSIEFCVEVLLVSLLICNSLKCPDLIVDFPHWPV
jgi:hypothetical protein